MKKWSVIVCCFVLHMLLVNFVACALKSKAGEIVKSVKVVKSTDCELIESSVGFSVAFLHFSGNILVIGIRGTQALCDFIDIPPENYTLAFIHDENMNGKLDAYFLGIPTEGNNYSNDVAALSGPPSFSAADFPYDGQNLELMISLRY